MLMLAGVFIGSSDEADTFFQCLRSLPLTVYLHLLAYFKISKLKHTVLPFPTLCPHLFNSIIHFSLQFLYTISTVIE